MQYTENLIFVKQIIEKTIEVRNLPPPNRPAHLLYRPSAEVEDYDRLHHVLMDVSQRDLGKAEIRGKDSPCEYGEYQKTPYRAVRNCQYLCPPGRAFAFLAGQFPRGLDVGNRGLVFFKREPFGLKAHLRLFLLAHGGGQELVGNFIHHLADRVFYQIPYDWRHG